MRMRSSLNSVVDIRGLGGPLVRARVLEGLSFASCVLLGTVLVGSVLAGVLLARPVNAQSVDPEYAVGTWRHFRDAAVTHTFDDNDDNQLAVAVPLFNEFGFRTTLFVITNVSWSPVNWSGLANASEAGHEIASHTVTHARLSDLSESQQIAELANSQETIRDQLPGEPVLTIAYPFCVRGDDATARNYYIAGRACQGSIENPTPADMMNISSMIVGSEGSLQTAADLNGRVESAAVSGGWAVFLTHGIDNDGGWSPVSSDELRDHVEYLDSNRDRFWVDTFGNVVRYIRERNAATVVEVSADDDEIVVSVTDTLEDALYDHPITIRRVFPEGWPAVSVTQNGTPLLAQIVDSAGEQYVMFDVVPDRGNVVLSRGGETGSRTHEVPSQTGIVEHYPNPSRSQATIVYEVSRPGHVSIEIYDLLGRTLQTLLDERRLPGRYSLSWDTSGYGPGAYVYRLRDEFGSQSEVLVVAR